MIYLKLTKSDCMKCTVISIWCDECNEHLEFGTIEQGYSLSYLREQEKNNGWIHKSNRDFCKNCVTTMIKEGKIIL